MENWHDNIQAESAHYLRLPSIQNRFIIFHNLLHYKP